MTMIKQLDGIRRVRRGEVKRDANGKALAPEAYDIFWHDDHIGYTQRLDGGKWRAFPIDGSFPTEEHKNHTEAVRALVHAFKPGSAPKAEAPAASAPAPAKAPAKAKGKAAAKATVTTQLTLVKDEEITPDPLAGKDVEVPLTTPGMTLAAPPVEPEFIEPEPCARCGKTEPHQHAVAAAPAEPELPDDTPYSAIADESGPVSPEFTANPDAASWSAGYPEPAGNPFASPPPITPMDTAAEEPNWMPGPGFAPEVPPFEPVGSPFLPPVRSNDPYDDTFTDPFSEA